jgi:hypothetical protein
MLKLVITILFLPAVFCNLKAQSPNSAAVDDITLGSEKSSVIEIGKKEKLTLNEKIMQNVLINTGSEIRSNFEKQYFNLRPVEKKEFTFNIVSSFRKNIRFGGFWENYAIINFTPDMFIQPFDFISIYASHNFSNYIPMTSIKENIKPLAIEGAVILAVDNTVKFLLSFNHILQSIAGFAAKNLVIGLIKNPNKEQKKLLEFKYYYYAISIRF